jgi:hypothetical protein
LTLKLELAEIADAVAAARRAVADGAVIEIEGLDRAVAQICDAAQTAPVDERASLAEDLVALADALDRLAADIVRQSEAAERRRAGAAYGDGG